MWEQVCSSHTWQLPHFVYALLEAELAPAFVDGNGYGVG